MGKFGLIQLMRPSENSPPKYPCSADTVVVELREHVPTLLRPTGGLRDVRFEVHRAR